jgi:D-apiose dehydrogenase
MQAKQVVGKGVLRGALLGAGSIAVYQLRAWAAIPGVEIVALANRTRSRAQALGCEYVVPDAHIYGDYHELLDREEIDFVDIATAPAIHREQVLAAAQHGVHILCQKPVATSLAEADEMLAACEAAGVRCVVNENWRWRRWYGKIRGLLDAGTIGRPLYARFQLHDNATLPVTEGTPMLLQREPTLPTLPQLIIFDNGIHLIDTLRFLLGDIKQVYGRTAHVSPLVRGDDRGLVVMDFAGGATGIVDLSYSTVSAEGTPRPVRGNLDPLVIEGDKGTIECDPYAGDIITVTTGTGTERWEAHPGLTPAEAYQDSYVNTQGHFVHCLRSGQAAQNELRDNLKTLAAMFAAYVSAATGEVIML